MQNTEAHNAIVRPGHDRVGRRQGFTLMEVMTALVILAFVSSSVLLVINRSITSAADSAFRMEAFELARENMETLLSSGVVSESVEYGTSELYAGISWRTSVETFPEMASGQMWVRAISSADYTDPTGEIQTVELVKWLTQLTDQQVSQLSEEDGQSLDALAAEEVLEYIESAAQYARVEPEVIEQWLDNGLVTTPDGAFIKYNLDIFVRRDGNPSDEEKAQQVATIEELSAVLQGGVDREGTSEAEAPGDGNPTAGMPGVDRDAENARPTR